MRLQSRSSLAFLPKTSLLLCFCLQALIKGSLMQERTDGNIIPQVKFQSSKVATTDSMLLYNSTLPLMTQTTICFRVKLQQSRDTNDVISYAVSNHANEMSLNVNYMKQHIFFQCCDGNWEHGIRVKVSLREWMNICFSVDFDKGNWQLVKNGKALTGNIKLSSTNPVKIRAGGNLIIGQEQDVVEGGFNEFQSLSGSLSDLRLYNVSLSTRAMVKFTECQNMHTRYLPVLSFDSISDHFEFRNVDLDYIIYEDTCNSKKGFDIVFPELRDFDEAELICDTTGGVLMTPLDTDDNAALFSLSAPYSEVCGDSYTETIWLGVKGYITSQKWLMFPSNQPITWNNFDKDNGLPIEDPDVCLSFIGSNNTLPEQYGRWVPSDCNLERCPACHFKDMVIIRMRGLCQQSEFDRDYFISFDEGTFRFTGVRYSEIKKFPPNSTIADSVYGYWFMHRLDKPHVTAVMPMKSPIHYPIGLNTWHVHNDVCGKEEVNLMMTSCKDSKFSCSDGTCINIGQRCDLESDCPDNTDESDCHFLTLPPGYNDIKPPPRVDRSHPVKVYASITIFSMRNIDLSNFQFTCELEIYLRWTDNRLTYHHLKEDEILNTVDAGESMPWIPNIEFLGDGVTTSHVEERRKALRIRRFSKPKLDNDEHIAEGESPAASQDELFDGKDNSLLLIRKLTLTTKCTFHLEAFPFDTQVCHMGIEMVGITKQYVVLVPEENDKGVEFKGDRKLLQYRLLREYIEESNAGNFSGFSVCLFFENMSSFYITSTYIPTLVIVIICYTVFYFPLWNFNERVMVGLTGLLVEAAFFSQVSENIPNTAYLKLVDIWFVYCIIILFLVVLALVTIQWLQESSKMSLSEQARQVNFADRRATCFNNACRIIFPILTLLFFIFYGICARFI